MGFRRTGRNLAGGWSYHPFDSFDVSLGRGYRIGDSRTIPAAPALPPPGFVPDPVMLGDYGWRDRILRWKVTLAVKVPSGGVDPTQDGRGLRFVVLSKMENERIERQCFVSIDNAQVIYAPGRSIRITAQNLEDTPVSGLEAHWQLDEFTAGLSTWEDVEIFEDLAAETALPISMFCESFEVFSPGAAAPAPRIRGYGPTGTLLYDEVLSVPRSGEIDVVPRLDYTITPTAANQDHVVVFNCEG